VTLTQGLNCEKLVGRGVIVWAAREFGNTGQNSRPKTESRGLVLERGQRARPVYCIDPITKNICLYSCVDHKPGSQFCVIFLC